MACNLRVGVQDKNTSRDAAAQTTLKHSSRQRQISPAGDEMAGLHLSSNFYKKLNSGAVRNPVDKKPQQGKKKKQKTYKHSFPSSWKKPKVLKAGWF